MATALNNYVINFTDPLNGEFLIQPFTANGTIFPTAAILDSRALTADTSLLFVGKGAADYGERIEEDILHVMENFAGSSEPLNSNAGQLWYRNRLYWQNTTASTWFQWDEATLAWTSLGGLPASALGLGDGDLYFNGLNLFELFELVDPAGFGTTLLSLPRIFSINAISPAASDRPEKIIMIHNGTSYVPIDAVAFTSTTEPPTPVDGMLWLDSNIAPPELKVWDGASWTLTGEQYLRLDGTSVMAGIINMGGFAIQSLLDPVNPQDAATRNYVDSAVSGGIGALDLNALTDVTVVNAAGNDGFVLTYDHFGTGDWIALAPTGGAADEFVDGGSFDGFLGELTLTYNGLTAPIVIPGFSTNPITVAANDVSFVDGAVSYTAANVQAALEQTDSLKSPKDSPFFTTTVGLDLGVPLNLGNLTPVFEFEAASKDYVDRPKIHPVLVDIAGGTVFTVPAYTNGYNNLMVFRNGVKQIADKRGAEIADMDNQIKGEDDTDLLDDSAGFATALVAGTPIGTVVPGLPNNIYGFDVTIDGGANQALTILVTSGDDYDDIAALMSAVPVVGGTVTFDGAGSFVVASDSLGPLSTTTITTGTTGAGGDLFAAITTNAAGNPAVTFPVATPGASAPIYTFTVSIDGAPATLVSVAGSAAQTFNDLITEIDLDLVTASASIQNADLVITSNTYGPTSSIAITDIDLFASLTDWTGFFINPTVGATYGYQESGLTGTVQTTITFPAAIPAADVLEFIIL